MGGPGSVVHTLAPAEDVFGDATARAEPVYEVVRFFYDEAKFRTPGPAAEREELAKVGDAARDYADRMFALRSSPDGV
ncbi:hypothetical protein [Streptomyces spectabilis]|uniref:Uncharacterized protein n=1 Tax=Streptomyces spectabilis TaxID=68270 RepID=A0A7W8B475_STRST|nr:hypothetical protein [Streptomyces spectabilis]MBB5109637.1 hypothetical protein [Streptomyces spectabilis]GGV54922.1 hypothetical protein GCM10010245_86900 [Streptomyces spectabilis]